MGLVTKINRCWNAAQAVHKITGENRYLLFCEVVWSWFRWGASDEDYLTMEFYRKNWREKSRWLTSWKNNRYLTNHIYTDEAKETFDNKARFDKVYRNYMRHEVLVCQEHSTEDVVSFVKKYGEVIVKPADGACGVGVYKCHDNAEEIENLVECIKGGQIL